MNALRGGLEMGADDIKKLKELIGRSERPLLTGHVRLDGDALGSQLALYHALRNMGKDPRILNDSGIPRVYKFLVEDVETMRWSEEVKASLSANGESYGWRILRIRPRLCVRHPFGEQDGRCSSDSLFGYTRYKH
jgi:hypothetical protein